MHYVGRFCYIYLNDSNNHLQELLSPSKVLLKAAL
jgi:hypothetical protein